MPKSFTHRAELPKPNPTTVKPTPSHINATTDAHSAPINIPTSLTPEHYTNANTQPPLPPSRTLPGPSPLQALSPPRPKTPTSIPNLIPSL